jgi:hypothetical protein
VSVTQLDTPLEPSRLLNPPPLSQPDELSPELADAVADADADAEDELEEEPESPLPWPLPPPLPPLAVKSGAPQVRSTWGRLSQDDCQPLGGLRSGGEGLTPDGSTAGLPGQWEQGTSPAGVGRCGAR